MFYVVDEGPRPRSIVLHPAPGPGVDGIPGQRVAQPVSRSRPSIRSAPDGHRPTCAITSSAEAASGVIQGDRPVSNTAESPRTQLPECWHTSGSKLTVTAFPTYDLRL